jgi:hypothetical protein
LIDNTPRAPSVSISTHRAKPKYIDNTFS